MQKAVEGTPFCSGVTGISSTWCGNVGADAHDQQEWNTPVMLLATSQDPVQLVADREKQLAPTLGGEALTFERRIDSQTKRLHKKIERNPGRARVLKTVWVRAYVLAADVVPA